MDRWDLLTALSLSLRNTPDHMQESQGEGYTKDWLKLLSAVCVRAPGYGTRLANYCVYLERLVKVFWTVALSKSIYFAFLSHSPVQDEHHHPDRQRR